MSLNIRPIAGTKNRVMVLPAEPEEKTTSGLFIPDNAKEKPLRGTVVAVSEEAEDGKPTVKVGDTVIYGMYAGSDFPFEGEVYKMMKESDIFAIV